MARIGEQTTVMIDQVGEQIEGRAAHQAPETDGTVSISTDTILEVGKVYPAEVIDAEGADLVAKLV